MPRPNNATVVDACARRLRALAGYVDPKTTIAINGRKLALADVLAIYDECVASRTDLAQKRAAAKAAMGRRATAEAARREADQALKAWARAEFGIESTEARDFGFPPAKKGVMTAEAKALAVARRQATREARHTMGSRQKEAIRGTLESATGTTSDAAAESRAAGERPWLPATTG